MSKNNHSCTCCSTCGAADDYASLEEDAAQVILAYLHGDKSELDQAVHNLKTNGRDKWWEKYKPIGLRGNIDDEDDCG